MGSTAITSFKNEKWKNKMLKKISNISRGILTSTLYFSWLIFLGTIFFISAVLVLIIPSTGWRKHGKKFLLRFPVWWMDINHLIMKINCSGKLDVQGTGELIPNGWYLVVSNHRSWIDIIVIGTVFNRKIPTLKFFMKKQLLWMLPLAGAGVYLLDYPFLERVSAKDLKKNPHLKGKDIETTKKACDKLKIAPTAIMNFVEGTRFTEKKHAQQSSPYKNLLKPKAGGIAIVINEMQHYLNGIINTTIEYSPTHVSFWDFCCGNFDKIMIRYEVLTVTEELIGDYDKDRDFRIQFQRWLNDLWKSKDELIDSLHSSENENYQPKNDVEEIYRENEWQ